MSARFASPDPSRLESLVADYGVPQEQWKPATLEGRMKLLRDRLKVLRDEQKVGPPKGVEPGRSRPDVLDDALYQKMK
jgi:hypothetical protein